MNEVLAYLFWPLMLSHFASSVGVGLYAASRGRSVVLWTAVSLLIMPALGLIWVSVLKSQTVPCWHCGRGLLPDEDACYYCGKAQSKSPLVQP